LAICKNTANERPTKDGKGYIHILDNSNGQAKNVSKVAQKAIPDTPKADADKLNEVYTAFLSSLELDYHHSDSLANKRGLSEQNLPNRLYASVPAYHQRFEVAKRLAESFDLEGVPGFYLENGEWALHLTYPGFYVPYRDEQGRIVGLQIRQDKSGEQKYIWLSSSNKEMGSSSGVPLHYVNPNLVKETNEIYITEGALKADIIGELYRVAVVAMGGVNVLNPEALADNLSNTFPNLEKIVLAFDIDWNTNADVRAALLKLSSVLDKTALEVEAIIWDRKDGKGLDDVLWKANQAGDSPSSLIRYVSAREYQEMLLAADDVKDAEIKETTNETAEESGKAAAIVEDTLVEDKFEEKNMNVNQKSYTGEQTNTFGIGCRDFLAMEFPNPERVMFGLGRGNLGLMNASTNLGKTTLALNLTLSATGNKTFLPLFDETHRARRVMYIDGEATKAELQDDIRNMLGSCTPEQRELIKDNLCFICDEELLDVESSDEESNDEPLDLVNPRHLKLVRDRAIEFKPDLIIVDTLSALTLMEDENDNAKVKKEVIQPLKRLAKKANAGVLLLHHTGKFIEGSFQAEDAYKGRGASAFGALSRVVFNLKQQKELKGNVALSCSKVKGQKFSPVVLQLNEDTRWFSVTGNVSEKKTKTNVAYEQVVNYVRDRVIKTGKGAKRGEIVNGLEGKVSETDVDRKLRSAVKKGDLLRDSENYGHYTVPLNSETEISLAE
jgi:hypothetical protein